MQAILHHELSLLVAGAVLIAIGWNAPNSIGMWTYLVLCGMRQSAKLNLFLGFRNLGVEFLPQHLRYLQSFFRRRTMNALFPWSILACTVLVVVLARLTLHPASGPFEATGFALLTSIAALGLLEHSMLMLPVPSDAVLDTPYALLGSREEIETQLRERRDRFGLSYYVLFERDMEAFAPIAAKLAGT